MTNKSLFLESLRERGLQRWHALIAPVAWLALGALALPLVAGAIGRVVVLMGYPFPADGLEGTLLMQAQLLWSGQQLYQPFELYRFVSAPYPPWHPLALGFADQFVGIHPFWSGRMVSLVSALLVLLTVVMLVRLVAGSWVAGVLAAAVLLSAPPMLLWATRIKPDMYALLWTALGLLGATLMLRPVGGEVEPGTGRHGTPSRERWLAAGAALCFALAFFTKQTALAGPLAAGLALVSDDLRTWLARSRVGMIGRLPLRWRTLLFGIFYLGIIAVTWLTLDLWSHGQFTFHVWTQHRNALWTPQLMAKFVGLLGGYWPLMVLAAWGFVVAGRVNRALVPAWYLLAAPLTLFGAGKTGANHNHLLETLLALVLGGGAVLGLAMRSLDRRPAIGVAVAALFALQLAAAYRPAPWYQGELYPSGTPERFVTFIRSVPGEVLADDPGLLYMAGKPARYDDPSGFGPVAHSGLWDQRGLVDDIANRRFAAILIPVNVETDTLDPTGRWTPEMLAAIREHYRLLYRDAILTYVPK